MNPSPSPHVAARHANAKAAYKGGKRRLFGQCWQRGERTFTATCSIVLFFPFTSLQVLTNRTRLDRERGIVLSNALTSSTYRGEEGRYLKHAFSLSLGCILNDTLVPQRLGFCTLFFENLTYVQSYFETDHSHRLSQTQHRLSANYSSLLSVGTKLREECTINVRTMKPIATLRSLCVSFFLPPQLVDEWDTFEIGELNRLVWPVVSWHL